MEAKSLKIALIGTGNVAWHIANAFTQTAHQIVEVYGRNIQNTNEFAGNLNALVKDSLNFKESQAEIILLAVSDNALPEIIAQMQLNSNQIVAHTSGSTPITIFDALPCKANFGVFYPLQTFSKTKQVNIQEVPFCIEGNSTETATCLKSLAEAISRKVFLISSEERLKLHLAAVFANNFVNHLLGISQEILQKENLSFELLRPLIQETFAKAMEAENIYAIQTGPARRNDQIIIQKHLQLLQNEAYKQKIYEIISESIRQKS
ncbi:Rossmann-like and DUF2520 domain-containing protein [Raineya orbicola]|uniref:DUF2520 domain-containing protein n=1 Tax=Raineya orbicola TaxID=2016530 RepID=A0A2N3IF15_9BACT|nr:Rossmann-like and DUF2520 domain-containing protein [Raineya orbicola]PKQ68875.1 hypothetical protein Rain11_1530 [Raineya orbicola]